MTLPTAPGRVAGQAPAARPGRNRTAMNETYIPNTRCSAPTNWASGRQITPIMAMPLACSNPCSNHPGRF
jgi:hypothetical protein